MHLIFLQSENHSVHVKSCSDDRRFDFNPLLISKRCCASAGGYCINLSDIPGMSDIWDFFRRFEATWLWPVKSHLTRKKSHYSHDWKLGSLYVESTGRFKIKWASNWEENSHFSLIKVKFYLFFVCVRDEYIYNNQCAPGFSK